MAIVQISKIQQRSGNLVDLPQLDDAEFGWASDEKRLFIGKSTPNENIEVLTSYSNISFSQINGSDGGNFNISNAQNGQILTYVSSTDTWENYTGNTSQLNGTKLQLGSVSNISITGGAIGYVLETDGTGNLSWTPKNTLYTTIRDLTNNVTGNIITMTVPNTTPYTNGLNVTISGANISNSGANSNINGQSFYVKLNGDYSTSGNVVLYTDVGLTITANGAGLATYTANSGVATAALGGSGGSGNVGGSNTTVQFNNNNILDGDADFTWNYNTNVLTINGNANVGNVNATANVIGGNLVTTGVVSTPSVTNGTSNVRLASSGNVSVSVAGNANILLVTGTGANIAGTANVTGNANVGNLGTAGLIVATGNVTGGNLVTGGVLSVTGNANVGNIGAAAGVFTGTVSVTGNANVGNLGTAGLIVATGNVTGGNLVTAGALSATGNANVGNIGAAAGVFTGTVSVTGNANVGNLGTAGIIVSSIATGTAPFTVASTTKVTNLNADYLDGYNTSTSSAVNSVVVRDASANFGANVITANSFIGNIDTAAQPNITSVGTLTSLTVTGNAAAGNLSTGGTLSVTGNANVGNLGTAGLILALGNVTGANLTTTGIVSATGNVTAGNVYANAGTIGASLLTGTLTTAAQPNITSVGTLTGLTVGGHIIPSADVTYDLGNATNAFRDLYLSNASIKLGNAGATISANATAVIITNPGGNAVPIKPGGANTQVQYNDDGIFGGNPGMVFNEGTTTLTVNNFAVTSTANLSSTTLTIKNITTGANTIQGNITGNWVLTTGSRLQATYADLAEYYAADKKYEPGTVLAFGGEQEVTIAEDSTTRVAGVVSTDPAYVMNMKCPGEHIVALALQGRVPTKVRGTIRKGDLMVSGGNGFARPSTSPQMGTVIGKALQNFDGIEGVIEIAVGRL